MNCCHLSDFRTWNQTEQRFACRLCAMEPKGKERHSKKPRGACKHCARQGIIYSRGLCSKCHGNLDIRALYAPLRKAGKKTEARPDFSGKAKMPEPTDTVLGSEERLACLEERARLGLCLSHPLDRRDCVATPIASEECTERYGTARIPKVYRVVEG